MPTNVKQRDLASLVSVGPKTLEDFKQLGVHNLAQLAREEPDDLYQRLCTLTRQRQDPCVLDVFSAAIAQARDPELPPEQCQWWYWSRQRKQSSRKV